MAHNTVMLGKAGTNETYIPVSLDNNGVIYTQQAPNTNAGIIQGYDIATSGGQDFGIVMDGFGAGINALPTNSKLYAENDVSGALQALKINTAGELIVSGGGGGGGGVVQIQDSNGDPLLGTNDALDVNVKGVDLITVGTEVGLATNILNNYLDAHCFGSSDGLNFHHIKTNPNGVVATNAIVQDSGGNDITGTATTTSIRSLDTASTLYSVNGTTRTAITATGTSLNVNVSNTVPVSGTFYPATQPVSGTVAISGTVPVSGTFYQATQPVSIAGTVAVSGTFYQATQPVSIASTVQVNQVINKLGDINNMASNISLTSGSSSTYIDVSTYGANSLITYQDSNINSKNCLFVVGTTPLSDPINMPILKLSPTYLPGVPTRYAYAYVDLSPFKNIRLVNQSSETLTNVYCSVVSG